MTEYVKVPKHLLEQLEEDRKRLYELAETTGILPQDLIASNVTAVMWQLANTNWEGVDAQS